ncbi:MAG: ankyrin repeat domain-containing protein, partial [Synergistaceae bacterium]|nr:ankyrin repeat domain-containing protein [Synergistaceae bacterium]
MAFTEEKFKEFCEEGNPKDLLQYLHDENVSPKQSLNGDTLLISAVEADAGIDILKALLDFGININAQNDMGLSALMTAIRYDSDFEIVKFLLDAGSDINAKDK